ncbi:MAG: antitoxin family protein [Nitrospinae bacterium]|nr:antitoxin family protein [Nitrospinota bacterium]
MQETVEAIYEDGVIKPLQKLRIKEHQKLTVTISRRSAKVKPENPAMSLVGIFESGIKNLSSEHDKYLYGKFCTH